MPVCDRWWSSRPITSRRTSSGCCAGSTSVCPGAGVLVVDDGSPDGTAEIVKRVATELPDINVLERASKSGLGSAYRAGFAWGSSAASTPGRDRRRLLARPRRVADPGGAARRGLRRRDRLALRRGRLHPQLGLAPPPALARRKPLRLGRAGPAAWPTRRRASAAYSAAHSARHGPRQDPGRGLRLPDRDDLPGASQYGGRITEVPIKFVDREAGESKMSSFIVVEALGLVTSGVWAASRRCASISSAGSRKKAKASTGMGAGTGTRCHRHDGRGAPARILVVDDEPNIAELLSAALTFEGYQVGVAGPAPRRSSRCGRSGRISSCSTSCCPTSTATRSAAACATRASRYPSSS